MLKFSLAHIQLQTPQHAVQRYILTKKHCHSPSAHIHIQPHPTAVFIPSNTSIGNPHPPSLYSIKHIHRQSTFHNSNQITCFPNTHTIKNAHRSHSSTSSAFQNSADPCLRHLSPELQQFRHCAKQNGALFLHSARGNWCAQKCLTALWAFIQLLTNNTVGVYSTANQQHCGVFIQLLTNSIRGVYSTANQQSLWHKNRARNYWPELWHI